MALSMLPAIEATYPDAHFTWMCGQIIEPLLRLYPRINELVVVNERALFAKSKITAIREVLSVQKRMFGRHFDLVLHGNVDQRYRLLTRTVRAGETRGWHRDGLRHWPISGRYHGDEYARLITGHDPAPQPTHTLAPLKLGLPSLLQAKLNGPGKLVVLSPGGAKNILSDSALRRWPVQSYAALAKQLADAGLRVALIGAESDQWVLPAFTGVPVINLIGQTTLEELLGILGAAAAVVSHDTSCLHLARLVATPAVALFGPTIPHEKVTGLELENLLWGGVNLPCRPCYDGAKYAGCANNLCMQSISPEAVWQKVEKILLHKNL